MRWKRRSGACCNSAPSGLQYGCSKRARKRFPALFMFEQIMTFCRGFKCGPAWTRTRDLFLIREARLSCSSLLKLANLLQNAMFHKQEPS